MSFRGGEQKVHLDFHRTQPAMTSGGRVLQIASEKLDKRPAFAQMITDAEAGNFDTIVVHKLDRFSRNLLVTIDTLGRLEHFGVGFASLTESIDLATPIGKPMLSMLASLAAFYSDNLSAETPKGKQDRKAQGLYNGLLPFGAKKNGAGVPVPDTETYPGLLLAFQLAAEGKSDRDVADAVNAAGYRTSGNRGRNLFGRDTVRAMLVNEFCLGKLPGGAGGWVDGAHDAMLDDALFERARAARLANQSSTARGRRRHRRYSLTGLAVCGHCGGRLHFNTSPQGRARHYCWQGRDRTACPKRSGLLDPIEAQLARVPGIFVLPEDVVQQLVTLCQRAPTSARDTRQRRRALEGRLARVKEQYGWGDLDRDAYLTERDRIKAELATLGETFWPRI